MEKLMSEVVDKIHYIELAKIPESVKKQVSNEVFDSIIKVEKSNTDFELMFLNRQIDIIKLNEFKSVLKVHLNKILNHIKKEHI